MYLKSIEVQGFKSFANRIVFEFHNGITGIVGPNGSGKSNVADAVRWVLGEQKVRQLRSSSMQDVIFAGTENRRPQSYAYVAITMDNSDHQLPLDYNEITVARRVYRSGESEYLINGTSCRLKDINELFYDTGIGQEGYSIIGQGQIERILSGRPEERRELFDEAAGIVKFKRRKQTAQKKLENEQQNLLRVNDIINELEKQVAPLERQSETARSYLKKKEELKIYDVNLFLTEVREKEQELEHTGRKLKIAGKDQEEVRRAFEKIRSHYEQMEEKIHSSEQKISQMTRTMNDAVTDKEKLEGQLNVFAEQIRSIQNSRAQQQERLEAVLKETQEKEKTVSEHRAEEQKYAEELDRVVQNIESCEVKIRELAQQIQKYENEIESISNEKMGLIDARSSMKARQQRYSAVMEQVSIRTAALNQRLVTYRSGQKELQHQLEEYKKQLEKAAEEKEELQNREETIKKKLDEWRDKYGQTSRQLEVQKEAFHKNRSRLESLKNIAERYDGYGISIRKVMEKRFEVPGIRGVVADIIKVERKYETAIETALGGSIQNIVTEDEETAKQMIAYLKKNRFGRATFLPMTSVRRRGSSVSDKVLEEQGVIGLADTLVETEEQYREIIASLLGRTIIADNIADAVALAKKYRYSLRIVTLEGELLQPGGSMTGGAFRNNSNLLGRGNEITQLENQVKKADEQMKRLKARLEEIHTARELLKDDLADVRRKLQDSVVYCSGIRLNMGHTEEELKQQEKIYREIQQEDTGIRKDIEEADRQKKEAEEKMYAAGDRIKRIEEDCALYQKNLDQCRKDEAVLRQKLSDIRVEESSVRSRQQFASENVLRVEGELKKLQEEIRKIRETMLTSVNDVQKKQQEIKDVRVRIAQCMEIRETLESQISECAAQKDRMVSDHKGYFEERESLSERLNGLEREIFRLNDQKEKLEEVIETQNSYMWDEYELTYHAALPLRDSSYTDISKMKKRIGEIREEIRKLGPVNVNAIEEYKVLSERYTFMDGQRQDILEAEKTLTHLIEELDEGMKRQFSQKFKEIQKQFNEVFRELFGGGKGTLELTEQEDLLESGVRITAQPPGKKLQNMMQLSGGEKSLTAIALLFAIQNLKPSPFCLLDEIEAALDDSNVVRFAKYLSKLTENTQFIIITHRRGTMSAADRLYGITMQEKGVSALVSVSLIENELDE